MEESADSFSRFDPGSDDEPARTLHKCHLLRNLPDIKTELTNDFYGDHCPIEQQDDPILHSLGREPVLPKTPASISTPTEVIIPKVVICKVDLSPKLNMVSSWDQSLILPHDGQSLEVLDSGEHSNAENNDKTIIPVQMPFEDSASIAKNAQQRGVGQKRKNDPETISLSGKAPCGNTNGSDILGLHRNVEVKSERSVSAGLPEEPHLLNAEKKANNGPVQVVVVTGPQGVVALQRSFDGPHSQCQLTPVGSSRFSGGGRMFPKSVISTLSPEVRPSAIGAPGHCNKSRKSMVGDRGIRLVSEHADYVEVTACGSQQTNDIASSVEKAALQVKAIVAQARNTNSDHVDNMGPIAEATSMTYTTTAQIKGEREVRYSTRNAFKRRIRSSNNGSKRDKPQPIRYQLTGIQRPKTGIGEFFDNASSSKC